jgi:hypothetical protein
MMEAVYNPRYNKQAIIWGRREHSLYQLVSIAFWTIVRPCTCGSNKESTVRTRKQCDAHLFQPAATTTYDEARNF